MLLDSKLPGDELDEATAADEIKSDKTLQVDTEEDDNADGDQKVNMNTSGDLVEQEEMPYQDAEQGEAEKLNNSVLS